MKPDHKKFMHAFTNIALAVIAVYILIGVFSYLRIVSEETIRQDKNETVQEYAVTEAAQPEEVETAEPNITQEQEEETSVRIIPPEREEEQYALWIRRGDNESCVISIELIGYSPSSGNVTMLVDNIGIVDATQINIFFDSWNLEEFRGTTLKAGDSLEIVMSIKAGAHTLKFYSRECMYNSTIMISG
jgi:hypothetical protein